MKSVLFLAPALLLASSSIAFSADAVSQIPEAPTAQDAQAFSWGGVYLGGLAGYGWTKGSGELFDLIGEGDKTLGGGRIGGFVGYNFAMANNVVLGVEGDLNYDWNKKTIYFDGTNDLWLKSGLSGSARVRAGYAFDNFLIYGAGGWTATRVKLGSSSAAASLSDAANGWTVGAGVDYAFTNNVFGRVEYRYNDFGSAKFQDASGDLSADLKQHVINIGVGVKF